MPCFMGLAPENGTLHTDQRMDHEPNRASQPTILNHYDAGLEASRAFVVPIVQDLLESTS